MHGLERIDPVTAEAILVVRAVVEPEGRVKHLCVERATPLNIALIDWWVSALRKSQYEPASREGVAVRAVITDDYRIKGGY